MQRRFFKSLSVLVFLIFLLSSCASFSSGSSYENYTAEEASEALMTAISTAGSNAATAFYKTVSQDDFLPASYDVMKIYENLIPGFKSILKNWKETASEAVYAHLEDFYSFIDSKIPTLEFEDPLYMVEVSDTSVSDYFRSLYGKEAEELWKSYLENTDTQWAEDLVNQYTNWIVNHDLLYGTNTPLIEKTDISSYLTDHITDTYFKILSTEEELFRTTPDAYTDSTVKKVFRTY